MKAIKYFLLAMFAFLAISCADEPILKGEGEDDDPPIIIGGGGTPGGGSGGSGGSGGGGSGGSGGSPRMSEEQKMQQDSIRVEL